MKVICQKNGFLSIVDSEGFIQEFESIDEAIIISEEIAKKIREMRTCKECIFDGSCREDCDIFHSEWMFGEAK